MVDHDLIIKLRNNAIAHSHPGKEIGGAIWEEQNLLLVATGSGYRPMHTMRTTQRDRASVERLERLLSFALDFFADRFQSLSNAMVKRLLEAGFTQEELLLYATDPAAFFADEAMLREALAQMPA